ncbi:MAG TPA: hypothetical protein VIY52_36050 [Streptosporangiaceae bacterium]
MTLVHAVEVPRRPVSRLEPVIGAPRYAELARTADQVRQVLAGRIIWNVNSTAAGGGVAEMLPSIDPFSPKNQQLAADTVRAILVALGVLDGAAPAGPATFVRRDGGEGVVTRRAVIVGEGRPGPDDPVLVQVSRWLALKNGSTSCPTTSPRAAA